MVVSNNRGLNYRTLSKLPYMQGLKIRIEWGAHFFYLTLLDIKIIFLLVSNLKHV